MLLMVRGGGCVAGVSPLSSATASPIPCSARCCLQLRWRCVATRGVRSHSLLPSSISFYVLPHYTHTHTVAPTHTHTHTARCVLHPGTTLRTGKEGTKKKRGSRRERKGDEKNGWLTRRRRGTFFFFMARFQIAAAGTLWSRWDGHSITELEVFWCCVVTH